MPIAFRATGVFFAAVAADADLPAAAPAARRLAAVSPASRSAPLREALLLRAAPPVEAAALPPRAAPVRGRVADLLALVLRVAMSGSSFNAEPFR
ncbi:MAG TPA: hypothetical protein VLM17_11715 [Xanthomonadaceae bacterium]|nr:hypothetical protein [Xanthomonadaceae bacterium]